MRRVPVAFALIALVALTSLVPPAAARTACTKTGGPDRDMLAGGTGPDVICGRGGNDYAHGDGGRDIVRGGKGTDALVGGSGPDRIVGGEGNDRLFAVDDNAGDSVFGGPGNDRCFGEKTDRFVGCERIWTGNSYPPAVVLALAKLALGTIELGEEAQQQVAELCTGHPAPPPICGKEAP